MIDYVHYNGNKSVLGDGTDTITSSNNSFGKVQVSISTNNELSFTHVSSPCGTSAKISEGCVNDGL